MRYPDGGDSDGSGLGVKTEPPEIDDVDVTAGSAFHGAEAFARNDGCVRSTVGIDEARQFIEDLHGSAGIVSGTFAFGDLRSSDEREGVVPCRARRNSLAGRMPRAFGSQDGRGPRADGVGAARKHPAWGRIRGRRSGPCPRDLRAAHTQVPKVALKRCS